MSEYQFTIVSGELPKGMSLSSTGTMIYYARNSDAYRNLSLARKVHWMRCKKLIFGDAEID